MLTRYIDMNVAQDRYSGAMFSYTAYYRQELNVTACPRTDEWMFFQIQMSVNAWPVLNDVEGTLFDIKSKGSWAQVPAVVQSIKVLADDLINLRYLLVRKAHASSIWGNR